MFRLRETKVAKEKFYVVKKSIKIWNVNIDNIIISKLIETKINYKYLIGCLDKVIRPLVFIMSKIKGHLKLKMEIKVKTIN